MALNATAATARHARVQERKKPSRTAKQLAEQIDREMRVASSKKPLRAKPWTMELRGTQHWLVADSVSVAALAQGRVTSRLQVQAARVVRCLHLLEEEL